MLITRESEYAIRMVRALADNEVKSVGRISDDERIPPKWAYKILKKMERAKLVKSFYGVNGGYQLDKEISKITMLDILTINENSLRFSECAHGPSCSHATHSLDECAITQEFKGLQNAVKWLLSERTMAEIFEVKRPSAV